MPKLKNSNATIWVIFKHCEIVKKSRFDAKIQSSLRYCGSFFDGQKYDVWLPNIITTHNGTGIIWYWRLLMMSIFWCSVATNVPISFLFLCRPARPFFPSAAGPRHCQTYWPQQPPHHSPRYPWYPLGPQHHPQMPRSFNLNLP